MQRPGWLLVPIAGTPRHLSVIFSQAVSGARALKAWRRPIAQKVVVLSNLCIPEIRAGSAYGLALMRCSTNPPMSAELMEFCRRVAPRCDISARQNGRRRQQGEVAIGATVNVIHVVSPIQPGFRVRYYVGSVNPSRRLPSCHAPRCGQIADHVFTLHATSQQCRQAVSPFARRTRHLETSQLDSTVRAGYQFPVCAVVAQNQIYPPTGVP